MSEGEARDAHEALQQAVAAMRLGDRAQARRLASLAARLDPQSEQPWLVLAALASPQASTEYLKIALERNPESKAARQGMHWAVQRLRETERDEGQPAAAERTMPVHFNAATAVPAVLPAVAADEALTLPLRRPAFRVPPGDVTQPILIAPAARPRRSPAVWAVILFMALFGGLALAAAVGSYVVMARAASAPRSEAMLFKPSLTPTATATSTPTPTPTPTATATFTPTPTATFTPTATATNTPTSTPLPTDTPEPPPEEPVYSDVALPDGVGEDERWVDVDLTNQLAHAYEGYTLVNTFVVSTGTWEHPTVTGQYAVYVKYRYTDMSGPGYYLRDVPYVMYFYKGYGLHGTYWHNNFGTPMSHGCVNLPTTDAGWLFDWASVGTVVNVHY
jgi:lipoprotein-anchoring transpeptidase ErfK/SrfK